MSSVSKTDFPMFNKGTPISDGMEGCFVVRTTRSGISTKRAERDVWQITYTLLAYKPGLTIDSK
jgi:hypothetical protein